MAEKIIVERALHVGGHVARQNLQPEATAKEE